VQQLQSDIVKQFSQEHNSMSLSWLKQNIQPEELAHLTLHNVVALIKVVNAIQV